jgi:hypothetical protein
MAMLFEIMSQEILGGTSTIGPWPKVRGHTAYPCPTALARILTKGYHHAEARGAHGLGAKIRVSVSSHGVC